MADDPRELVEVIAAEAQRHELDLPPAIPRDPDAELPPYPYTESYRTRLRRLADRIEQDRYNHPERYPDGRGAPPGRFVQLVLPPMMEAIPDDRRS